MFFTTHCFANEFIKPMLNEFGHPSKELCELLKLFEIQHDNILQSIVDATQKSWLRKPGLERWHIVERFSEKKDLAITLLSELGFVDEISPSKNHYRYAFVLGGLLSRITSRINYLIKLWEDGIRFDEIIFLTGERYIEEIEKNVFPKAKIETDLMEGIWQATNIPHGMSSLPLVIVDAKTQEGKRRPDRKDTIEAWLSANPEVGSILAISNQPHCFEQTLPLKTYLPSEFEVDVAGDAVINPVPISLYLDAVARVLYQENERLKIKGTLK